MTTGKLTISIDLELAWGVWDTATPEDLRLAETAERPICAAGSSPRIRISTWK